MDFDGTEKVIGRGAQAVVYRWHGFAYKVYRPDYPADWIAFECAQQRAARAAGLTHVRYWLTDDAHCLRMDFVDGPTLEERVNVHGWPHGFADLAAAHRFVHGADAALIAAAGERLLPLTELFVHDIDALSLPGIPAGAKARAKDIVHTIPHRDTVCHLDLHFQNLLFPKTPPRDNAPFPYVIIDWMNARLGNPVFDYARSYVIFAEFAPEAVPLYERAIAADCAALGIGDALFRDAVSVCALLRLGERDSPRVRALLAAK